MVSVDYELEALLSLDGFEFRFAAGYWVKIEAQRIDATKRRPHGVKYSLTLHDPEGRRIFGLDNAHGVRRLADYDHRHVLGVKKLPLTPTGGRRNCWRIFTARRSGLCESEASDETQDRAFRRVQGDDPGRRARRAQAGPR